MSQPEISLGRFVANASFNGTPFRFVKLSSGKLVACGAGEAGLGVVQDEAAANEAANVMIVGVSKVLAGGSINQGNPVKSDASGRAVVATETDQFIFGTALEDGANGEYIDVLLLGQNMAREGQASMQLSQVVPATAQGATANIAAFRAPFDCTIEAASYVPVAAITGNDTNSRSINFVNRGLVGTGTDEIASVDFTAGNDGVAFDEKALTLSGTPANLDVDEGEIIAFQSVHVASGLADPGGLAVIQILRR